MAVPRKRMDAALETPCVPEKTCKAISLRSILITWAIELLNPSSTIAKSPKRVTASEFSSVSATLTVMIFPTMERIL